MNKKGFTVVEVLAVMIILGLLMLLVVPSINKLMKDNDEKKYSTYEKMMEEYAKVHPDRMRGIVYLSQLDNLDEVKKNCDGYVLVHPYYNIYDAYITCGENGDKYETLGFDDRYLPIE